MPYFAAALAQSADGWSGREIDMDSVEDLDSLVETLRDLSEGRSVLFFLEEDDEYLAIVRIDGDSEPRTFISDDRVVGTSARAALIMEDVAPPEEAEADDDDEGTRPDAEVAGDVEIVASFGVSGDNLVGLCATEGMLPADIVTAICEKAGCADALDELREG
ncbi:MAG TPA: tRNA adenosine deaminase-associated protein [Frankiaceae bacterium]|nr:tRNA adenosine deaminase-associated protein [Frankiaceae bacterium]